MASAFAAGQQPAAPARGTSAPAPASSATAPKPAASHAPAVTSMLPAEQTALVKQYCVTCHNDRSKAGQMSLAAFDAAKLEEHGELTEKMIRKLRSGMMPPVGCAASGAGGAGGVAGIVRIADGSPRGAQSQSGLASLPAPQPRRVRERGARLAERRRRRLDLPAAGHHQPRLRQRRRLADVLADPDGRLPARRQPDQPSGRGRSSGLRHLDDLQDSARRVADAPRRRRADGHARRRLGRAHVPRRRPLSPEGVASLRAAGRPGGPQHHDRV